jgi:1-propanol dehydrogenase
MAEKAITLVFRHLIECCQNGQDLQSREKMQHASCMAGIAFDHAGLGLNHAIAHQLGAHLHIPHGLANALVLTRVIEYNCKSDTALKSYGRIAKQLGLVNPNQSDEEGTSRLMAAIEALRQAVGIDGDCKRFGIKIPDSDSDIKAMADAALKDETLATNPVTPSQADIIAILKSL